MTAVIAALVVLALAWCARDAHVRHLAWLTRRHEAEHADTQQSAVEAMAAEARDVESRLASVERRMGAFTETRKR